MVNVILNRDEMLDRGTPPSKEVRDRTREMARPLTPKSERPRSTYGSMEMSLQSTPGLCEEPKCCKRAGHSGECWPKR